MTDLLRLEGSYSAEKSLPPDLLEYGSGPSRHWKTSGLGCGVAVVATVVRVRTILPILDYLALKPRNHVQERLLLQFLFMLLVLLLRLTLLRLLRLLLRLLVLLIKLLLEVILILLLLLLK
jgi:hypothetical protein